MAFITLFHGSQTDNIETLEPRKRFVPSNDTAPLAAIYASDHPAYAAAHAFPWFTAEGVNLYFDRKFVVLEVPKMIEERLKQPIFIYTVPANTFEPVASDAVGHNFRSLKPVKCLAKRRFETVIDAVTTFGGTVTIKPS
jgi:hypothetical protein